MHGRILRFKKYHKIFILAGNCKADNKRGKRIDKVYGYFRKIVRILVSQNKWQAASILVQKKYMQKAYIFLGVISRIYFLCIQMRDILC